jgi:hypothetical protein
MMHLFLRKMVWAMYISGDFFTSSSGRPGCSSNINNLLPKACEGQKSITRAKNNYKGKKEIDNHC